MCYLPALADHLSESLINDALQTSVISECALFSVDSGFIRSDHVIL